jgi:hypothetical protein
MRRFIIFITFLFALFALINAISAATPEGGQPSVETRNEQG